MGQVIHDNKYLGLLVVFHNLFIQFIVMSDRDYAPLSPACVKALNDKMYDKRKAAALEIEK